MIVTRGLGVDSTDYQNGSVTMYGFGIVVMLPDGIHLNINMDGQMQNLDGGMRG